ncbi:MAG: hypothetical protein AB7L66_05010 [Gemmatimonadales bacterium]
MPRHPLDDFLLFGSIRDGERFYVCRHGDGRNTWVAYDVEAGGRLTNPRVVFGEAADASWRGLPLAAEGAGR